MMTDPIADMLTRIRNANVAMHDQVRMPSSKQKEALAAILKKEGYIEEFAVADDPGRPGRVMTVTMKYSPERKRTISGLRRISKPGLRVYTPAAKVPRVLGGRSEEHTSELQSQSNLVCRLLLEKKKNTRESATPATER